MVNDSIYVTFLFISLCINNSYIIKIVCSMHKHRYCPYKYGCNTMETFIVYPINSSLLRLLGQWDRDMGMGQWDRDMGMGHWDRDMGMRQWDRAGYGHSK
jgi:hypothetical protein